MAAKLNSGFSLALGTISIIAGMTGLCGLSFWGYEISAGREGFDMKAFLIVLVVVLILLAIGVSLMKQVLRGRHSS